MTIGFICHSISELRQNCIAKIGKRMNIDHLKTFHRIAEIGNFTQAARDLFLTQPAVSMQVQSLENTLGVPLFDRSRRKVNLTSEGRVLYEYTQRIFSLVGQMQDEFQSLSSLNTGRLVLGASAVMSAFYLPNYMVLFHQRYPGVTLDLAVHNSHIIAEKVYKGQLEIGFCGSSPSHPNLRTHFLHREPLIVVAGKKSELAKIERPISADELLGHPFILREQGTRVTNKVHEWFKNHAKSPERPSFMTVDNMEVAKQLVINGLGITALPKYAAALELAAGQLTQLRLQSFDLHVNYSLVYMEGQRLSRTVSHFLSLLFELGVPLPEDILARLH